MDSAICKVSTGLPVLLWSWWYLTYALAGDLTSWPGEKFLPSSPSASSRSIFSINSWASGTNSNVSGPVSKSKALLFYVNANNELIHALY